MRALTPFALAMVLAFGAQAHEAVSYFPSAKRGEIHVHEEGEEGTFPRKGMVPVGNAGPALPTPSSDTVKSWQLLLCEALKTPAAIHFPTGDWKQGPPKSCVRNDARALWIDRGAFKNTGILEVAWPAEGAGKKKIPGRNALAIVDTDASQKASKVLKVVGGLSFDGGDMAGQPVPVFVTEREIVLRFDGYVSQWQIVLTRAPGTGAVTVEELR